MNLLSITNALEGRVGTVSHGFNPDSAHSYRGFYRELAFSPAHNVDIEKMYQALLDAVGQTYTGWKGGEYVMHEYVEVYIACMGSSDATLIGRTLMDYWLGETT